MKHLKQTNTKLTSTDYKKIKGKKRRRSENIYYERLRRLYQNTAGWYPSTIIKVETGNQKYYYKRLYRDNHAGGRYKYHKKLSNRKIRHNKIPISKGGNYKKVYDFWWNVE